MLYTQTNKTLATSLVATAVVLLLALVATYCIRSSRDSREEATIEFTRLTNNIRPVLILFLSVHDIALTPWPSYIFLAHISSSLVCI